MEFGALLMLLMCFEILMIDGIGFDRFLSCLYLIDHLELRFGCFRTPFKIKQKFKIYRSCTPLWEKILKKFFLFFFKFLIVKS